MVPILINSDVFEPSYNELKEKAMAPHSSTLAWKIPRMEEPGRLQSMGSLGTLISQSALDKNPMPGHLFEGNPVSEGTTRRGTDTPVHRPGRRLDALELWCWGRLSRIPWTARRSNQSILKEISTEYSLEGLMLKLTLQYFGHLM